MTRLRTVTLLSLLTACSPMTTPPEDAGTMPPPGTDGAVPPVDSSVPLPDPEAVAVLEVHAMDVWAQDLPAEVATLTIARDGAAVAAPGWPIAQVDLTTAATYDVVLAADDHEELRATITFDGTDALDAQSASAEVAGAGVSVSHESRTIAGRSYTVHTVHLGARHRWFSAQGRPARRGNRVRLMTSGEEAWQAVADELLAATDTVNMATWWWESDFELVRDPATHVTSTLFERELNTVIAVLDDAAATKRVLVGQLVSQDGVIAGFTTDGPLIDRAEAFGDGFEHLGEANLSRGTFFFEVLPFAFADVIARERPELAGRAFDAEPLIESTVPPREVDLTEWPVSLDLPIASYHQKFATVDGRVAFVGGMNLRRVDWDTDAHLVFEPRRMLLDSTTEERIAVENREALPDTGPRKDYMTRIEGPLVQDVDELFQMRWSHLIDEGVEYADAASDFAVRRDQPSYSDGVQAQLTATLPAPYEEHAIAETWFNAIDNAEHYILIEDQYFRIPMLVEAIVERMTMVPTLELVVITKPVSDWTDPGCEWTARTHQELSTRFPTRYSIYQLRAFDYVFDDTFFDEYHAHFVDMDVHSKLLVVDDAFLSVGSCNKNNRGIVYEGELNLAIFDRAWVREARRRVLGQMLPPGTAISDDSSEWIVQIAEAASWNQYVWDNWDATGGDLDAADGPPTSEYLPEGFLYPLEVVVPDECLLEGVGPDMT